MFTCLDILLKAVKIVKLYIFFNVNCTYISKLILSDCLYLSLCKEFGPNSILWITFFVYLMCIQLSLVM